MKAELVIKDCKVVLPGRTIKGGVAVSNGRITKVASDPALPDGDAVVDGRGRYLLPGAIDSHVHFREPGYEYKEDFGTGSLAAAAGGVTTVVDMPSGIPYMDSVDNLRMKFAKIAGRAYVDYGQNCMLADYNLDALSDMVKSGAVGFKWYMSKTAVKVSVAGDGAVLDGFRRLAKIGVPTAVHAENDAIITYFMQKAEKEGGKDIFAYAEGRPKIAEVEAIQRAALFSENAGNRIHILHLTSKDGLVQVVQSKARRISITAETCPHYLLLSGKRLAKAGSIARINPPIRGDESDRLALWKGLADGSIDTIGSDHSPHRLDEKEKENVWEAASGFNGVETLVPLMLTEVRRGRISIERYVEVISESPAKVYNLYPKKGVIKAGSDADLTLVDFGKRSVIKSEKLRSKTKVTPYEGWEVTGSPVMSFLRGRLIMEDGDVVGKPSGKMAKEAVAA